MAMSPRLLRPLASRGYNANLPATIANLEAWWDAADSSTLFDAASGGSPTANLGDVGRWEDKSGNDRHATQGIGANRPQRQSSLFSGRGGLFFDGDNDLLTVGSSTGTFNFLHDATGGHVFVVMEPSSGQGNTKYVLTNNTNNGSVSGNTGTYFRYDETEERVLFVCTSGGQFRIARWQNDSSTPPGPYVFSMQFDAHQSVAADRLDARRNGVAISPTVITGVSETGVAPTGNASQNLTVGGSSGTAANWFEGAIGEIIMYSGVLAEADRDAVEAYLRAKWRAY